jgi:hypothetical protein
VNIFRATAVRKALHTTKAAHGRALSAAINAFYVIKERFLNVWDQLRNIFTLFDRRYGHLLIMAE